MKRAIIVGAAGQDGRLLDELLRERGYDVIRLGRRASEKIAELDLLDGAAIARMIDEFRPDEIYYLPAFHQSSEDRERYGPSDLWRKSFDVHVTGAIHFLEAIRTTYPSARLFYAASCLVFGPPAPSPQDERTPFSATTIYGITKATGIGCGRFYRSEHRLFVASGILYNHESILRGPGFLSQKVVRGARRIKAGLQSELVLADLSAETDWGFAPDYVNAMTKILQCERPDDYIIATGKPHTVRDFVEQAFSALDLDWRDYVREEKSLVRASRGHLVGNPAKLLRDTGWQPSVNFAQMVARLTHETVT